MMLAISLGMLLAQQGRSSFIKAILVFVYAVIFGAWLTRTVDLGLNIPLISLVVAGVLGMLVAIKLKLNTIVVLLLSLISGFLVGQESAPVLIPGMKAMTIYAFFIGATITSALVLTIVSLISLLFTNLGNGIVLRVLGSWVVAAALMVQVLLYGVK